MTSEPLRLFHPTGSDRVAVVSVEPATGAAGQFLIRVGRGQNAAKLTGGQVYGPFSGEELTARWDEVVAALRGEGFAEFGAHDLLNELNHAEAKVRARAALRLGWLRSNEAVPLLINRIDSAVDDLCSLLDALGMIGDDRAREPLRKQAERKLLSRRRSAVEALRNLDDADGLAAARERAIESLPGDLRSAVEAKDSEAIAAAIEAGESIRVGHYLDTLYEIGDPECCQAVVKILDQTTFARPYVWRYVKSILKRSMLRHDTAMFGWLAHRIERSALVLKPYSAHVKSGYDGVDRNVMIFSRNTTNYVRRSTWRYLRQLAKHRPELYTATAAEVLIQYDNDDPREPRGRMGQFAKCYLLSRILFGSSSRFTYDDRRLTFRFTSGMQTQQPQGMREEAYPELWDRHPRAYLRILSRSQLPEVFQFALDALARQPDLIQQATADDLTGMLSSIMEPVIRLALAEINRRFDPTNPDWQLLDRLMTDERDFVIEIAHDWLRKTAPLWTGNYEQISRFVECPIGETQALVVDLVTEHLSDESLKQPLAERFLTRLRDTEAEHLDAVATLSRTILLPNIDRLLSTHDMLKLITTGTPPAQAVAAEVLGRRPNMLVELGMDGVLELTEHNVFVVRAAGHSLMRSASDRLRDDPSPLFTMIESRWDDTRQTASELLRVAVDWSTVSFEAIVGLLDSNRVDVQDFAIDRVRENFERIDAAELVYRLVQHPHRNMRRFALSLVKEHLPAGAEPLKQLRGFFQAGLFDPWPQREVKYGIVDFLLTRGLADREQGRFALDLLGSYLNTQIVSDFERVLEATARLRMAWPEIESPVSVPSWEGEAPAEP